MMIYWSKLFTSPVEKLVKILAPLLDPNSPPNSLSISNINFDCGFPFVSLRACQLHNLPIDRITKLLFSICQMIMIHIDHEATALTCIRVACDHEL